MKPFDAIAPFYDLEHDGLTLDTTMYVSMARDLGYDILVMGAGTGRVVLAMAEAGFRVWGVDNSLGMLKQAALKLAGITDAHMIHGDVRMVDLDRRFDLVIIPLDTFSLLETAMHQAELLAVCEAHLRSGGRVVLDLTNPLLLPDSEQNGLRRPRFETALDDGSLLTVVDCVEVEADRRKMRVSITYNKETNCTSETTEVTFAYRWVYRAELVEMMKHAGLKDVATFGDYEQNPYQADSSRLIAVAAKA